MLNPTPDELLSAYLDGELSPSETASLEQRLSTDSSLREQLQELRELSQTLRQLPRSNAPAELHQSVMETIHRLPPITTTTSGAAKSSTKGFSLLRRRWWTGVISAGLLLCLLSSLLITPREWHPLAVSLHEKEANIQSKESPEWNLQESPALAANKDTGMASAEMASATLMVAPASSPITPPTAPTPSIAASGTVSSLGLGEQEQQTVAELPVPVVTMTNEEIRRKIESLQRAPAVGNSIQVPARMVESTGETPIVVVFTVVDVHQAMNQMQVLLQKQQVRTLDNKPVALLIGDSDKQSNSLQADGLKVVSLELEMNGPEMAAVLQEVPALEAVMYLADTGSINGMLVPPQAEESLTMKQDGRPEISRASVPARPEAFSMQGSPMQAAPLQDAAPSPSQTGQMNQMSQNVQFRFDQLNQSSRSLSESGSKTPDSNISDSAAQQRQRKQEPDAAMAKTLITGEEGAKPEEKANSSDTVAPTATPVMTKTVDATPRYRAIILFQQPPASLPGSRMR